VALGAAAVLALWLHATTLAQERDQSVSPQPQDAAKPADAQDVEQQLDRLLSGQQQILKRFDEVLAELQIVKTRAARRRAP
jgi:hypothetical protein